MNIKILICLTIFVLISCAKSHPNRVTTLIPPTAKTEKKIEGIVAEVESVEIIPFQISQVDYDTLRKKLPPLSSDKNFIYFIDTKKGELAQHKLELTINDFNNKIRILLSKELQDQNSIKSGCYLANLSSLVAILNQPSLILKLTKELCTFAADKNIKHPVELIDENIVTYRIDPTELTLVKKQVIKKNSFTLSGLNFSATSLEKKIVTLDLTCKLDLSDIANKDQQIASCTEDFKQALQTEFGITIN